MLYAIARREGTFTGGAFRKNLKTIRGFILWGARCAPAIAPRGCYVEIKIYRSEHPDHPYGNDTLIGASRVLVT